MSMNNLQSRVFSDLYRRNESPIMYGQDRSMAAGQEPPIRSLDRVLAAEQESPCHMCPLMMIGIAAGVAYFLFKK